MTYILLAEDDPGTQMIVRRKLSNNGLEVRVVNNGADALRLAKETRPLLLLLDVNMPGQSGLQVCREVKLHFGQDAPKVVFLTSNGREADVEAGRLAGADDYLIKPVQPAELLNCVLRLLGRSR